MTGLFECEVIWQNGERDVVLFTEISCATELHVTWKHDENWRGMVTNVSSLEYFVHQNTFLSNNCSWFWT